MGTTSPISLPLQRGLFCTAYLCDCVLIHYVYHTADATRGLLSACVAAEKHAEDSDPTNRTWLEKAVTGPGSTIALAFICNKALMPVRVPITIALTPAVARWG